MKASHHPASTDPGRGSSLPGTSQRNRSGIVLILVFMLLPILAHGAGPLRVATEGAYPPFNYLDEQGRLTGFDVDLARALCAALETECTFTAVPWEELIPRLESGEYDVIVASMARTPEREQRVDFTEHYYRSRSAFVARSGSGLQPDRQNLRGKRLAAPVGSVQAEYLVRRYADIADIVTPPTSGDAFAMLAAGEVDAVLSDSLNGLDFLDSERGREFDFVGDALPPEDVSGAAHIAVRKGELALVKRLNRALARIRMEGTYDRINHRYFPFSIY
ncbi:transporter substrate-binding domain-containing protein [Thioalbus denitrificans]|uniref:Amino acid ABC transporter substrate-binding protein (PAAT family) n=1 Tax=Thioalbus denitrificans TaxID=547122 RepID=A0A369CFW1_9GAMM|nr:transporter substrate-binding domain-containing protein [Thioalbus denitrificans]RCX30724.1 amino acid ABC transporter substrate-binding protein (PAAT family) [Thioalbus denitrificans]